MTIARPRGTGIAPTNLSHARMPLPPMTETELASRYQYFSKKCRQLAGHVIGKDGKAIAIGQYLGDFFERLSKFNDPETVRRRNEFMDKVKNGDPDAKRQFFALRLETYNNYIWAEMQWISYFFQVVTLGDDERPIEQNDYDHEMKCYYVGADGRPKIQKVFKAPEELFIPLNVLTTPIARYLEVDIYRGNIADVAVKTLALSRDMTNKMEFQCKGLLDSVVGPFTFTGPRANWPYVANSYIDTANLPATNDVKVVGAFGYFDYGTLDEIINYAKLVNGVMRKTEGGVPFRPTGRIRVVPSAIRWFGTFAPGSTTPGTASPAAPLANAPEQQIWEDGWGGVTYKGINWTFEPDPTLPANSTYCYPEFSVKPGRVFQKPSQDREFFKNGDTDSNLFMENAAERSIKKVFNATINTATRILFARFNYAQQ